MVVEDSRVMMNPGQVLDNIRHRMERIDLDPDTAWAPQDVMSLDEMAVLFDRLRQGRLIVSETAWYARQILIRWPAEFVEHPIPPEARVEGFFPGTDLDLHDQDLGRQVINRALASPQEVDTHPELNGLTPQQLMGVWVAVLFWFGAKSGALNQRHGSGS